MAYFRKRGNKWYFTIEIGTGSKRQRKELAGGRTKAEAQAAYAKAVVDLNTNGEYIEPTKKTLDQFAPEWLAEHSKNVKSNTIKSYTSIYKTHISPAIGERQLRSIRPTALQGLLNDKKLEGLAESTVSSIMAVLKKMFIYASDFCEYIPKNPAQNIKMPSYVSAPKEVQTFSAEQIQIIFDSFPQGHQFYLPLAISYHTGARFGECCALTWQDVDFDKMELSINKTVIQSGRELIVQDTPNTSHSFRTIPIGRKLIDILKREKRHQAISKLAGHGPNDNYIIHAKRGGIMGPNGIHFFNHCCKEWFGNGYSFHSMRHTHATMLLEAGEDLELVSKRLGHGSMATTARVYSHVLDGRKELSRHYLDNAL